MIAPTLLLVLAVAGGTAGGTWLHRSRWPAHAPRLGIWAWVVLSISTTSAALLAGLALAVPTVRPTPLLTDLLDACWASVRAHYATPGGLITGATGLVLAIAIATRLLVRLVAENLGSGRARRDHRARLLLIGRPDPDRSVLVLPCADPAVYCLPGRPGLVVCTSAALDTLGADELQAVLAHEQAHLRGRHHRVLTLAAALRSAFPFVPAFRLAETNLATLIEMRADDTALVGSAPQTLGSALVKLAGSVTPRVALGVGGGGERLLARVQRLSVGAPVMTGRAGAVAAAVGLVVLVAPVLVALGPAAVAVALDYCPPGLYG